MVALTVLVITFLVLLGAGLLVYATFFIVNKIFLNKTIKLMSRYNKLSGEIHSINFFKIEVLIKHDLAVKEDLDLLKKTYKEVSENAYKIHDNLTAITDEINHMNLKPAIKHLKNIKVAIEKNEAVVNEIKSQYSKYTSYGDTIDNIAQTYEDIYEALSEFYDSKIRYKEYFNPVNDLFNTIGKSISNLHSFKLKFDYKQATNVLLDLKKKLQTLSKGIETILRYQIVLDYLLASMEASSIQINQAFRNIDGQDLQIIKKLQNSFSTSYINFRNSYLTLDFSKAKKYAADAADAAYQVQKFVYVHLETPDLINISLKEIDNQTKSILENKEKIENSLKLFSKYFLKDPVITKLFNEINNNINDLDKLAASAKVVLSKTYTQKIVALKQIANISQAVYQKKEEISKNINTVNQTLSSIIQIITELNDLYVHFWQLLVQIKKISTNTNETKDIEALINNNLDLINSYAKQIVEDEHPKYSKISYDLTNMVQNVIQVSSRLKTSLLLKSYATKLVVYSNRYKLEPGYEDQFASIERLYLSKHYKECIEEAISLIKLIKKQKKSKKQ